MENKSVFSVLNAINCNEHVEKKNGLSYLSWAWAWQITKQNFPDANYTIYENPDGWNYFTDGRTCWVKTGVTINGQEHIEDLPVMDFKNRSILLENVTSFDVNKAIQRSLTKALARHGLGLYIYAGEDLPDAADDSARAEVNKAHNPFEPAPIQTKQRRPAADPASYGIPVQPAYQPMEEGRYWDCIAAAAEGQLSRTGRPIKDVWASMTHAGPQECQKFDQDLANYKYANNIQ